MNRRQFVRGIAAAAIGSVAVRADALEANVMNDTHQKPATARLPRWRGFNLLEKFNAERSSPFQEADIALIASLGFDFVRLPMSYRCWTDPSDWLTMREDSLKEIDQAVEFGRKHGVHVNLNFHRAPGYCVNPPKEPLDLWTDDKALEICSYHWARFAERYKGTPNTRLSFDLLNEPGAVAEATYCRVVKSLVEAIRSKDPNRLIIADGVMWGTRPVPSLVSLGVAQSTRGYAPIQISHYRASWMAGSDKWPEPDWPLNQKDGNVYNKERIRKEMIEPWKELERKGVGIHVGEWGAFNQTPHRVVMSWMRDMLDLWKEAGWGWAMWNFRGPFGPIDSGRTDVKYEDRFGHKVDREMLELLKQS